MIMMKLQARHIDMLNTSILDPNGRSKVPACENGRAVELKD